jgi:lipopolysaccharide transport system ATP-binding protein
MAMKYLNIKDVILDFPVYSNSSRLLKNTVINKFTGGKISKESKNLILVRALNHINLNIAEGDRIGIIGHNGSGKTTLLRLITGVYSPTFGQVEKNGSLASLINITTGLEGDNTGEENIITKCLIMGLSIKQAKEKMEEIKEFSELGDYIYMPLRTYSSGMVMRLAFSIATSIKNDIVVLDEWLSAGDEDFQVKAKKRLDQFIKDTPLLVLASHNINLIKSQCNKIYRMNHGNIEKAIL